ncbi:hypothetical protein BaRGS_00031230 [Batillaria attramentaria]|uniref:Uncharacterized protein n=1 Tax=Batillaria attramentaria TaxID=370345 RepID=A0ABD0JR68_9CAEN
MCQPVPSTVVFEGKGRAIEPCRLDYSYRFHYTLPNLPCPMLRLQRLYFTTTPNSLLPLSCLQCDCTFLQHLTLSFLSLVYSVTVLYYNT